MGPAEIPEAHTQGIRDNEVMQGSVTSPSLNLVLRTQQTEKQQREDLGEQELAEELLCARCLNAVYSFNNVYCVPVGCHALRWGAEEWKAGLWPSGHPQAGGSGQHVP